MTLRLLATSFTTALLLAGALGCSKEDDPQAATSATNTASYTLDGRARTCKATQEITTASGYDYLTIGLTTTPQPSSGEEKLVLSFRKPAGQATTAYELVPVGSMLLYSSLSTQSVNFFPKAPIPTFTGTSVAGTFSGEAAASLSAGTYTVLHTITAGTYTDVRP
jgi:hypothetical protein